jgi:Elongation factor P (EF-P) KOW-like domain
LSLIPAGECALLPCSWRTCVDTGPCPLPAFSTATRTRRCSFLRAGLLASADAFIPHALPARCAAHSSGMLRMASTGDFKTGLTIEVDGAPVKVLEFLHVKVGFSIRLF